MNRVSRVKKPSSRRPSDPPVRLADEDAVVAVDRDRRRSDLDRERHRVDRLLMAASVDAALMPLAARGDLGQHPRGLLAADLADVLLVLEDDAERLVDELRASSSRGAERQQRGRPVERLGDARAPWSGRPRAADGRSRRPRGPGARARSGTRASTISNSFWARRVVDPVVQAAPLERVVDLARPVRGQDRPAAAARPGSCRSRGP